MRRLPASEMVTEDRIISCLYLTPNKTPTEILKILDGSWKDLSFRQRRSAIRAVTNILHHLYTEGRVVSALTKGEKRWRLSLTEIQFQGSNYAGRGLNFRRLDFLRYPST